MQVRHLISQAINSLEDRFRFHQDVEQAINGGIEFGNPSSVLTKNGFQTVPKNCVNINGVLVNIPNSGAANTPFIVIHNLGRIPISAEVKRTNISGIIIDSGVAWTTTTMSLEFTGANAKLTLFIH